MVTQTAWRIQSTLRRSSITWSPASYSFWTNRRTMITEREQGKRTMNKTTGCAAALLLACVASTDLFGGGAAVAISVPEGDNVVWVSLVRRIGVDYLVVSYEDGWNGTGKHYLSVRAQSSGEPCGV
jgi:hypothetical protein